MHTNTNDERGRILGRMTCLEPGCDRKFTRYENVPAEEFEAVLNLHLERHRLDAVQRVLEARRARGE